MCNNKDSLLVYGGLHEVCVWNGVLWSYDVYDLYASTRLRNQTKETEVFGWVGGVLKK